MLDLKVFTGLLDVGDLLHTVDGESVRELEISAVVQKMIGPPNARVTLEIFRPRATAHIPPTPVMISPFNRQEIVLKRELTAQDTARGSKIAGLGILFHKVTGFHTFVLNSYL
jgi:C-terminal processing protease CtpA/Prc